ncbi:MAG: NAD-dependent epimerase/dehydratase family protein [Anaerolineae bacterium]|nr:NAD-dependent epimerase/dehydratase family protein [Anaerolineae bacterium]
MTERILVTGGAGFIGSHLVDALLDAGHSVRVFDSLEPQVHGGLRERGEWPDYLAADCEKVLGDVRDRDALRKAFDGMDVVFHQAAAVGVGQSMYEVARYVDANTRGTAVLLDILANERHSVRKLVVASSMSIYGEGKYHCDKHGEVYPKLRSEGQLAARDWEMRCPMCGRPVEPLPTGEDKPLHATSIYAITKKDQEEMCLTIGRAYGIPTVALRYFNTYGPRQALSNPYTGVAAIFSGRLLNGNPPVIFEDGLQSRDFTHVSDIVQANLLALAREEMDDGVFNVGTGQALTILDVAEALIEHLAVQVEPEIVRKFRAGDIRHCFADVSRLQALGYRPRVRFEDGMAELVAWVRQQQAVDGFERARQELARRGLA